MNYDALTFSHHEPPCYQRLVDRFGGDPWHSSDEVVTYGGVIYCRHPLPKDVIVHESVHIAQQESFGDSEMYLDRYLTDRAFRLSQELEAYRTQLDYIRNATGGDRNAIAWAKEKLAKDLAGMYDLGISRAEARRML